MIVKTPFDLAKVPSPIKAFEEQTKRNIEMFQNAMRMFTPFPPGGAPAGGVKEPEPATKAETEKADDLQTLKEQIAAMQRKIDSMG